MASNGLKTVTRKSPAKPAAKSAAKTTAKPAAVKVAPVKSVPAVKPALIKPPVATAKSVVPAALAAKIEQPVIAAPAAIVEKGAEAARPVVEQITGAAESAVEKSVETTAALTPAIKKEVTNMEATIKNAADKTQAYFADAQDRAKTAWEKSQKVAEDMAAFNKGNVEAMVESGKIAAKGLESMSQEAADYSRKQFEAATATLKSLSSVKSPTELFKLQSDFMRSSFDSIVAETSKNTEAMLKLAGEIAQPISNRVSVAVEKVKVAA